MDQAKAATVAAAIVNAGFFPTVTLLGSGQYEVSTQAHDASVITVDNAKIFQDQLGVAGSLPTIVFI